MKWIRAAVIFLVAALLRVPHLADRPMHADEAVQAARLDGLRYDPHDYHGPLLRLVTPVEYGSATETSLRMVPAIAGCLLAAVPGPAPFYAGLYTALSPGMTWYSRDYIPEILLVLFTYAMLICGWRYSRSPGPLWAAATGVLVGLMYATKETALIAVACAAAVWVRRVNWRDAMVAGAAAVLVALAFLGPAGFVSAIPAYASRGFTDSKHFHPAWYYVELLVRTESPILVLAIAGAWKAPRLAAYAGLLLVAYSVIPYKTPWCALTLLHACCLLAGYAVRTGFAVPLLACVLLVVRSPEPAWQYAETTPDVFLVRDRLAELGRDTPIQVISRGNLWPLPWYLRGHTNVRWWTEPPVNAPLAPVVLASPDAEPALIRAMYEAPPPGRRYLYAPLFHQTVWLRNGVEIRGYRRP